MSGRRLALESLMGAALLAAAMVLLDNMVGAAAVTGENASRPSPPRTADGHPDLQGIWDYGSTTPLQRPIELGDKATLTPQEAAAYQARVMSARLKTPAYVLSYDTTVWFPQPEISQRTSLIVDPPNGRLPPMTGEGQQRAKTRAEVVRRRDEEFFADGPEDRNLWERCIASPQAGPPIKPGVYNNTVQIFQTSDVVAILHEMIHHVRVIPLASRPRSAFPQWKGESSGHWTGDTLVIETTNLRPEAAAFVAAGASEHLKLVERFTRVDDDSLFYQFTVEDPATWVRPWTAEFNMRKATALFEYACHEGNHGLVNILSAARAADRARAEAVIGK